jgi:hypothetical protein
VVTFVQVFFFWTNILYAFLISPMRAIYQAHLILINFIIPIILLNILHIFLSRYFVFETSNSERHSQQDIKFDM